MVEASFPPPRPSDQESAVLTGAVLLGLDTCGERGTIALVSATATSTTALLAQVELGGRSCSEQWIATLQQMLEGQCLRINQLAGVIVAAGPGSFTGVRVGLSAAKGLVEATGIPLLAVSRLATLAAVSASPTVLAVLDAGRGEYFCGEYRAGVCVREWLGTDADIAAAIARALPIVAYEEKLMQKLDLPASSRVHPPTAADAIRHALPRYFARAFDDAATLDANYLRNSDAELFARATGAKVQSPTMEAPVRIDALATHPSGS